MARLNPADPDYEIKKLLAKVGDTSDRLGRSETDPNQPTDPNDGTTQSIAWDPVLPHTYVYTSTITNPNSHVIDIPESSLMHLDTNGRTLVFPTLAAQ